jgi:hypothetical protein
MPFTRRLAWSKDLPNLYRWGVRDATIESMANWHTMVPGNYVIANLLWDVNSDVPAMLDEFYANYYGPAGPAMREYNTLLENAYESTNAFAGCTFSIHRIFTSELMSKLEAALARAVAAAKLDALITRRVGVTRHSLNFAKHWLAMRSALNDFRLAEAEKDAQAFLDEYKTADGRGEVRLVAGPGNPIATAVVPGMAARAGGGGQLSTFGKRESTDSRMSCAIDAVRHRRLLNSQGGNHANEQSLASLTWATELVPQWAGYSAIRYCWPWQAKVRKRLS